jgi:hypothetical protein
VRDAEQLLLRRSLGVLIGSLGTVTFDLAVLGVCFLAFGYSPPIGVLALGYLIGQLGGNIPVPGGIGDIELGLIGTFALYPPATRDDDRRGARLPHHRHVGPWPARKRRLRATAPHAAT